jgi:hypothetical protein
LSNFEPRIGKWKADEVDDYLHDLKDGIVNKGRQERMAKAAWARVKRKERFRKTIIGRIYYAIKGLLIRIFAATVMIFGMGLLAFFCYVVFSIFGIGSWVFGS